MCDISTQTKLKRRGVYKVAIKLGEEYFSCFSGKRLKVGEVKPLTKEEGAGFSKTLRYSPWMFYFDPTSAFYNPLMRGRVSGFATLKMANVMMCSSYLLGVPSVLLRVVLGGSILKGTTKNIGSNMSNRGITYAGTEILSIEEISP